jgi:2-amino-4-hydroxy-6-hydroxymethyldihydropteridine diphosphokinase
VSRAFLSLGSNLGDREGYLKAAVRALENGPRLRVAGVSRVYETEPVEVSGEQPDYLNCVVEVWYGASALELLRFCQGVESALDRVREEGTKAARTMDIDVLLFGEEVIEEPDLTVPHPGIGRAFNLKGLADLAPELELPGGGKVEELLEGADLAGVRLYREYL